MEIKFEHILKAIRDCDEGKLKFNLGNSESFLFEGKWYPIRKIVNSAHEYANQKSDYNLHQATMILTKIIPVNSLNVNFKNNRPVDALLFF